MNENAEAPVDLMGFRASMRMAGIEEVVDVTIDVYLEEAPELFRRLASAAGEGDLGVVDATAHTLKSSSANIWANGLAEMFADMERAARAGDRATVEGAICSLGDEFERVTRYLSETRTGE